MQTYRIGVIGAGMMGKTHSWCWQSLPFFYEKLPYRCVLHGVATSRIASAEAARDALGFARAYETPEALIADPEIDIVDIASPNDAHADQLLAAAAAGKKVYCDKPLTGRLDEAERLAAALPDPASVGQMVFHNRCLPATILARKMVGDGRLGEIIGFRGAYLHAGNVPEGKPLAWKDSRAMGAGVLYDLGSHLIDLVTWTCGSPLAEVHARQVTLNPRRPSREDPTRWVEQDSDDMTLMSARLASGAVGSLECSKIATGAMDELRFEIHGRKGALRFNLMDANWLEHFDAADPEMPYGGSSGYKRIDCVRRYPAPAGFPSPKATVGWLRAHLHSVYTFIDAVHTGAAFEPSIQRGIDLERMLAAVERAARSGVSECLA